MEFIPTKEITAKISTWFGLDPNDNDNIVNSTGIMLVIALVIIVIVAFLAIGSFFV